jgi:hypothetical protein
LILLVVAIITFVRWKRRKDLERMYKLPPSVSEGIPSMSRSWVIGEGLCANCLIRSTVEGYRVDSEYTYEWYFDVLIVGFGIDAARLAVWMNCSVHISDVWHDPIAQRVGRLWCYVPEPTSHRFHPASLRSVPMYPSARCI